MLSVAAGEGELGAGRGGDGGTQQEVEELPWISRLNTECLDGPQIL